MNKNKETHNNSDEQKQETDIFQDKLDNISKLFEGFVPKLPSKEEMTKNSREWYKPLKGVTFKDWKKEITQQSIRFDFIYFPKEFVKDIVDYNLSDKKRIKKLEDIIGKQLKKLDYNEFFIKLISRSPKDFGIIKTKNAREIIELLASSMRTTDDLVYLENLDDGDDITLVIRPFIEIEPKNEFRVFVKSKEIKGISQYDYQNIYNYENEEKLEKEIIKFIEQKIIPFMEIQNFVVDIAIIGNKIIILETNPYGLSDPCLFESYENLDGSFKVKK
ncbi:hypothetical protein DLH72_04240 [Candidatus Gracilibacteria bacterium]|nr:MAG: hypothetical protein DLH72_04240 [Candidatus Gracilibacteria bacterium]